jgi:F-type H+-transporting ATPase subunit epsilon
MPIRCEIVSQDRMVFEGDVDMVIAPSVEGEIGVLPDHAPLIAILDMGFIKLHCQEEEEVFTVTGGFIEVQPDIVTVMAEASEHVEEIDVERARKAREQAKKTLEKGPPPDTETYLKIQAALRRSQLRLEAVEQFRKRGLRARPPGMGSSE